MAKTMKTAALLFSLLAVGCALVYMQWESAAVLAVLLTLATTAYHFVMRLTVGFVFDRLPIMDYRARWFRVGAREQQFYERLNVKAWKGKIPTYDPTEFDGRLHSWEEIVGAMCRAELVHETIMVLSFVPMLLAIPFGELWVFACTSVAAACFDGVFVMVQRYNRPRVIRLMGKERNRRSRR